MRPTNQTVDVGKVQLLSEVEARVHKPFKLRKTFSKYTVVCLILCVSNSHAHFHCYLRCSGPTERSLWNTR